MTANAPRHLYGPIHRATEPVAPPRRRRKALVASLAGLAIATTAVVGVASAQPSKVAKSASPAVVNTGKIYFGVDGTVSKAVAGLAVARHVYSQPQRSVPNARMVTMGTGGASYSAIASAAPGSSMYNNIVRWAATIKARGSVTFFGFMHEPEAKDQAHWGSAGQYIAAYQHVVNIMRTQKATNIRFVWQVTAYGFVRRNNPATNYYPGDAYVDDVAADPYNWGGCGSGSPWRPLGPIVSPVISFAHAHSKLVILGEFASQAGSQRAAWLRDAQAYFIQNRGSVQAAFYFDRPPTSSGTGCNWSLTSSADVAAFRAIVNDTPYFTS
jgi:hypothetical protein